MVRSVSVIIPCYNAQDYLSDCLETVLSQTLGNIEIICIDDGSTDNTRNLLKDFECRKRDDQKFIVISQKNSGVGSARNRGIEVASGKFVCFMDPDDFYPNSNTLSLMYENAIEQGVLICGGSFSRYLQTSKKLVTIFSGDYANYSFKNYERIKYRDYQYNYGFHRFIYDREFLLKNKIFFPNLKRYQDPLFMVKAFYLADCFYALPDITYVYRKEHRTVKSTFNNNEKMLDAFKGINELLKFSFDNNLNRLHDFVLNQQLEHVRQLIKGISETGTKKNKVKKNFLYLLHKLYNKILPKKTYFH